MDIRKLLDEYKEGIISLDEAERKLKIAPVEDIGYAVVDHQREMRNGYVLSDRSM